MKDRSQTRRLGGTWAAPTFVAMCVVLGGASAAGVIANLLLQLLGVAIIAWFMIGAPGERTPGALPLLIAAAAILAIGTAQLIPLPMPLWQSLPPRDTIAQTLDLAGARPTSMALSLTPHATVAAVIATVPAIAVALLILRSPAESLYLPFVIAVLALVSIALGVGQAAGGSGSALYIYEFTNRGYAVGLFANKNHLATLALVALPCLAFAWRTGGARHASAAAGRGRAVVVALAALLVLLGIVMSGSDAGLLLAGPTAVASVLIARNDKLGVPHLLALALFGVGFLIAATVYNADLGALVTIGADEPLDRRRFWLGTVGLIASSLPFGTGLGSFASIYRTIEDPATVVPIFINHAHNDYLEIALETGVLGIAAMLVFLAWWFWRVLGAWRSPSELAKTASVVTAVILAHSTVDYPLRTAALMAIFAACCAILARPFATDELPANLQRAKARSRRRG